MLAEFLKKNLTGKTVTITLQRSDRTGKILEFSPDAKFLFLEDTSSFGMGKSARRTLVNIRMIETIEIIQEQEPSRDRIPEQIGGVLDDIQGPLS